MKLCKRELFLSQKHVKHARRAASSCGAPSKRRRPRLPSPRRLVDRCPVVGCPPRGSPSLPIRRSRCVGPHRGLPSTNQARPRIDRQLHAIATQSRLQLPIRMPCLRANDPPTRQSTSLLLRPANTRLQKRPDCSQCHRRCRVASRS